MLFGFVVQIGDGEIGAEGAESGGTTPRNRLFVGNAHDEPLFALQQLGLDSWNQPSLAVLRQLQRFAASIPFSGLLQGCECLAAVLRFGGSCDLLTVHLQLPFAPW